MVTTVCSNSANATASAVPKMKDNGVHHLGGPTQVQVLTVQATELPRPLPTLRTRIEDGRPVPLPRAFPVCQDECRVPTSSTVDDGRKQQMRRTSVNSNNNNNTSSSRASSRFANLVVCCWSPLRRRQRQSNGTQQKEDVSRDLPDCSAQARQQVEPNNNVPLRRFFIFPRLPPKPLSPQQQQQHEENHNKQQTTQQWSETDAARSVIFSAPSPEDAQPVQTTTSSIRQEASAVLSGVRSKFAGALPHYHHGGDHRLLLPPMQQHEAHKVCLIVDLDETLVHSSFKPVVDPSYVVPVEIDGMVHKVYVQKRPYVDEFLERISVLNFEVVLFTASLAKYADPVADLLDVGRGLFRARLFREACVYYRGNYVKDLSRLGRDLRRIVIVDNSPASYAFHPSNAVAVSSWFDDMEDRVLLDIVPLLERLSRADNVYRVLQNPSAQYQ